MQSLSVCHTSGSRLDASIYRNILLLYDTGVFTVSWGKILQHWIRGFTTERLR